MQTPLKFIAMLAVVGSLVGCNSAGANPQKEQNSVVGKDESEKFGNAILKEDWPAAYALTTKEFQKAVPLEVLKKEYTELLGQIRADEPQFKPDRVEVDLNSAPSDESETTSPFDQKLKYDKGTWRAVTSVTIGKSDGAAEPTIERGVVGDLLIVDTGTGPQIGNATFQFLD